MSAQVYSPCVQCMEHSVQQVCQESRTIARGGGVSSQAAAPRSPGVPPVIRWKVAASRLRSRPAQSSATRTRVTSGSSCPAAARSDRRVITQACGGTVPRQADQAVHEDSGARLHLKGADGGAEGGAGGWRGAGHRPVFLCNPKCGQRTRFRYPARHPGTFHSRKGGMPSCESMRKPVRPAARRRPRPRRQSAPHPPPPWWPARPGHAGW
jgi:hypothetical protein